MSIREAATHGQAEEEQKGDDEYNPDYEDAPVPSGTILPKAQHSKPVDQRPPRRQRQRAEVRMQSLSINPSGAAQQINTSGGGGFPLVSGGLPAQAKTEVVTAQPKIIEE